MKSIKRRFEIVKSKNPHLSDLMVFAGTVREQKFSKDRIRRYFKSLVPADDYYKVSKEKLLNHMYTLTIRA